MVMIHVAHGQRHRRLSLHVLQHVVAPHPPGPDDGPRDHLARRRMTGAAEHVPRDDVERRGCPGHPTNESASRDPLVKHPGGPFRTLCALAVEGKAAASSSTDATDSTGPRAMFPQVAAGGEANQFVVVSGRCPEYSRNPLPPFAE